jgi:hypothetical protein
MAGVPTGPPAQSLNGIGVFFEIDVLVWNAEAFQVPADNLCRRAPARAVHNDRHFRRCDLSAER